MASLGYEAVVDTSVVVKFFVDEEDTENARLLLEHSLLGETRLVVPDYLFLEFANVLWVKVARRKLTEQEALEKVISLLRLAAEMEVVPVRTFLPGILEMSCKYGHPSYDVAFLVLAERRNIQFVTADRQFHDKVKPHSDRAVLLSDLEFPS